MREQEIRPAELLQRYLELSAEDARACFATSECKPISCVGCGSDGAEPQFQKNGFQYARCRQCGSLFVSPRPPPTAFEAFYRNSVSSRFWAEEFFPRVAEARRDKIIRPRVEKLTAMCAERSLTVERLIDVGAGYGIFLDEWRRRSPQVHALAIEPSRALSAECRSKGFEVVEDVVENVRGYDNRADLVVCFEVLEHVYDPLTFVKALVRLVCPGGYVFLTALGVDGFDIQTLWEQSDAIFPPHHINFLSVLGFERLLARAKLTEIDITTPGQLDVDIVRNAVARFPEALDGQRFIQRLLADEKQSGAFQQFLAANRLSSHTWILGRKAPGDRLDA
jgi:SAM-dependent methyltransferase